MTRFQVFLAELMLKQRLIAVLTVVKLPKTSDLTDEIKLHLKAIIHGLEPVVKPDEKLELAMLKQALSKEIQPRALETWVKKKDDLIEKHNDARDSEHNRLV